MHTKTSHREIAFQGKVLEKKHLPERLDVSISFLTRSPNIRRNGCGTLC